jgi:hypothetical protein
LQQVAVISVKTSNFSTKIFSTLYHGSQDYSTVANIKTVKVVVKHVPDYSASREKNDLGFLTFDLQADLTPLFNWNVKQLFLYLTAEYTTPANEVKSHQRFKKNRIGVNSHLPARRRQLSWAPLLARREFFCRHQLRFKKLAS